jgi:hypothetical protein
MDPSWVDYSGFAFQLIIALLARLHFWAFIWPEGKVSRRLHPPPPPPPPPPLPPSLGQIRQTVNQGVDRLLEGLRPPQALVGTS